MQMDNTEATRLTRSVPNIATIKMNTPIISVQSRYGRPVRVESVAPPVANATGIIEPYQENGVFAMLMVLHTTISNLIIEQICK